MPFADIVQVLMGGGGKKVRISRGGPATKARLAVRLASSGRNVVVVAEDPVELHECHALIRLFLPECSAVEPPAWVPAWAQQVLFLSSWQGGESKARSFWNNRLACLYAMRKHASRNIVLTCLDSFIPLLPPVTFFAKRELTCGKGMEMAPDILLEQAAAWGYSRLPLVTAPGDIAMRGDILDIFCSGYACPLRLEFFGDTLEDIRIFDPKTQRSIADIPEFVLLPASPLPLDAASVGAAKKRWTALHIKGFFDAEDARYLERTADSGGRGLLPGMWFADAGTLQDWLPKKSIYILPGENRCKEIAEETVRMFAAHLDTEYDRHGIRQPESLVLQQPAAALAAVEKCDCAYFEDLPLGVERGAYDLPERPVHSFRELFPDAGGVDRPWQRLVAAMRAWSSAAGKVVLSFAGDRSRAKFLALAEQDGIRPQLRYMPDGKGLFALVAPFRGGTHMMWDNFFVLGEDVLQPKTEPANRRVPAGAFRGLNRYDDMQVGDFLVHRDYGIASFGGLHRMRMGGAENDYLLLRYAGDDRLYVPVDRLDLVQRYKAPDGTEPAPDKLGGSQWASSKGKAQKAIEKIAEDLVDMYAYRKVAKGFSYQPAGGMYREFEASFGFEETPDQARAIDEVLADMEKREPMDRLVCGDVGFGKTEVAMRAAFRAVLEGRQVALLCPTTVLADQHYRSFRARFADFPVNVGMLSRFVPPARQKEVVSFAARGQIDILIGTHRLLSQDVSLPNLGLLVLDEEQRFGVRHKERLKDLRKNVDVLTLSATPIPRTLQLSLSGIRELSVIETAPLDRKPVATAIIDRCASSLKNILDRELARKGQVFWVYNRVQGLERVAEFVRTLAPDARVGMAHGQMPESGLENTMHQFWNGELDVLVCTSIIESGLDFPRANTLIVDQAQCFGLGQLYQLRGRVGRSDRQAYAVFVVADADRLPEETRQRLRIILDLDYLGAGFQVAMEDLRLRGAGNILGETQSGHMSRLGLELFLDMLEQAVSRLKGAAPAEQIETELNLGITAHIPETYMADSRERLKYYKALSSAVDNTTRHDIESEMRDRFGPWPEPVANFLAVLVLKRFLSSFGVVKADIFPDRLRLAFTDKEYAFDPEKIVAWGAANQGRVRFVPPGGIEMRLPGGTLTDQVQGVCRELGALRKE